MTKCYIYGHKCIINNKWYVGQTVQDPFKRFGSNGKNYFNNHQLKFENAIKKYSWDNFDHIILEICDVSIANEREVFWISKKDSYINGYNSTPGGDKLSEGCKRRVLKIDSNTGDIISCYDSAVEAALDNNLYNGSCIAACCNKKLMKSSGYCWCYEDEFYKFKLPVLNKKRSYSHRIAKIDPNTKEIIEIYESPKEAGIANNIPNMSKNINRLYKNTDSKIGGWNWKFIDNKTVRYI